MAKEKMEALVPVEEQPYSIPGNWRWAQLGACCDDLFTGKSPKYSKEPTEFHVIGQQANQRYGIDLRYIKYCTEEFALSQPERYFLKYNDVLLNTLGTGSIGRSGIYKSNEPLLTDGHPFVFRMGRHYVADLLYYYLQFSEERIIETANGSTNQKFLSLNSFSKYPLPLPPYSEQQRIVDRIESLFAKLDEAKEKAQMVVDGFEDRKVAVLHQAFTGKLTAEWRDKVGIPDDSWQCTTVGKCSELITKGASPRWQGVSYSDDRSQTLFITSENVREGYIDWTKEKYLDNKINEIQKRSVLHCGDVLVNIVGASIGRAAIFDRNCLANTNQAVCIIRTNDNILNEFLCYFLNSPIALNYYDENKVETARANVSLADINHMPISVPTIIEQQKIVDIVLETVDKETRIKQNAEQVISQIDTMKKAILARAFRGELGTNDPSEPPAEIGIS